MRTWLTRRYGGAFVDLLCGLIPAESELPLRHIEDDVSAVASQLKQAENQEAKLTNAIRHATRVTLLEEGDVDAVVNELRETREVVRDNIAHLRSLLDDEQRRQGERKLVATIRELEPGLRETPPSVQAEYYGLTNLTVTAGPGAAACGSFPCSPCRYPSWRAPARFRRSRRTVIRRVEAAPEATEGITRRYGRSARRSASSSLSISIPAVVSM